MSRVISINSVQTQVHWYHHTRMLTSLHMPCHHRTCTQKRAGTSVATGGADVVCRPPVGASHTSEAPPGVIWLSGAWPPHWINLSATEHHAVRLEDVLFGRKETKTGNHNTYKLQEVTMHYIVA